MSRLLPALTVTTAAVGLTLLFWGTLWSGGGVIGGDTYSYYMPQKTFLSDSLHRGDLPLWNPLVSLGYPILAESQTGVLYPPNLLLYRLLSVNAAYNASHLAHYIAAYVFLWLFARRIGLRPAGAHLAAVVYVYGWFPTRVCLEWAIIGGAYVPFLLWCFESYLQSARMKWLMFASIGLGMFLLAGHFNLAFILLLTLAVYVPARLVWARERLHASLLARPGETLVLSAVPVLLGFLLAAAQLLPTIELKSVSQRNDSYSNQLYGNIPVWYLTQMVWPLIWYGPDMNADQVLGGANTNKIEAHLYFGIIPFYLLVLAAFVMLRSGITPHRKTVLWAFLGLAAMGFATGGPIQLLRGVPGFSFFAGPGRYGIVTTLAVGLGAGGVFDLVLRNIRPRALKGLVALGVLGLTVVDLWYVGQWVTNAVQVTKPPVEFRGISTVRKLLDREPQPVRAFAPGPNLPTIIGVNCVPEYLGIGPTAYYDPARAFPRPPGDPTPEVVQSQIAWLRQAGVTHLVSFEPLHRSQWPVESAATVVDPFFNAAWARRANESLIVDRLQGSRPLAFFENRPEGANVTLTRPGADEVVVEVESATGGRLVLLDLAYPGWNVTVDGKRATPLVAEETYRAVEVPAGRHRVEWRYRPSSVLWGCVVSGVAWLMLVVWAGMNWRMQRLRGLKGA